jgi:hypothetical protein
MLNNVLTLYPVYVYKVFATLTPYLQDFKLCDQQMPEQIYSYAD